MHVRACRKIGVERSMDKAVEKSRAAVFRED